MTNWKIGDLAVCIDDSWAKGNKYIKAWPIKGCIYQIRGVVERYTPRTKEVKLGLLFEEILNYQGKFFNNLTNQVEVLEPAYDADKFRPVKKTSIDCFTSLLSPSPETTKKILEDV